MKIKLDTIGFTERRLLDRVMVLEKTGLVLVGVGLVTTCVSVGLRRKSQSWVTMDGSEEREWILGIYNQIEELFDDRKEG